MIQIKNLSFYYKKKSPLFTRLSVEMQSGSIIGLLGKNGAGKSTLLNLLGGLIRPSGGELSVNGFVPSGRKPDFLSDIYLVPEEFGFPQVSIGTYVKAFSPMYPSFDEAKLHSILKEFELTPVSNLNKLSHGQRKKFLIAFALASNCKVLILDEPTNGLDIPSKSLFRKILVSSVTDEQLVIISTHQVKDIDTIIDKVVVLDQGKLLYQEDVSAISSKFCFETVATQAEVQDAVYSEACPAGYRIVTPVIHGKESVLDLELLFNAIINRKIQ
jgi:ABC-2 type transport system ATP-binding protein